MKQACVKYFYTYCQVFLHYCPKMTISELYKADYLSVALVGTVLDGTLKKTLK